MTGLHHREPGVVGAAMTESGYCELIADTLHVHPSLFPLLANCLKERLVLITDCTRAGGLGDGEYTLGGQPIFVDRNACRMADRTLAGSVLKMNDAVRNFRDYSRVPMYEAVSCSSAHPAASIGRKKERAVCFPGGMQTSSCWMSNAMFNVFSSEVNE